MKKPRKEVQKTEEDDFTRKGEIYARELPFFFLDVLVSPIFFIEFLFDHMSAIHPEAPPSRFSLAI